MLSKDFKWENTSALHNVSGKLSFEFFFLGILLWNRANLYHDVIVSFAIEIIFEACKYLSSKLHVAHYVLIYVVSSCPSLVPPLHSMIASLEFPHIHFHPSIFSLTTFIGLFSLIIKYLEHFSALLPFQLPVCSHCFFCCFPSELHASTVLSYLEWQK